jgi:5-methylcytosine-specific restriction protein A
MRNPKWHRDEIILALELYFDPNRGSIDKSNPKVIALSEFINQLPIFEVKPDGETFRNPNGISLKLSNFLALDPDYPGKGMGSYSTLDEIVFNEFKDNHEELRQIARQIRVVADNPILAAQILKIEDDENTLDDTVKEGQLLYKLHKIRERDPKIVKLKKKQVWQKCGCLACEACGFDYHKVYGTLGEGFIECHHIEPLAGYDATRETKLADLALLCANCHRMIHRNGQVKSMEELRKCIQRFVA